MANDWFRRQTWTPEDALEFAAKLKRARSSRPEYLRIQALTLAQQRDRELAPAAVTLARQYLAENPEGIFRAQVLITTANAYATLGDELSAIDAYRDAMAAERRRPNVHVLSFLEFAWFVVGRGLVDFYGDALRAVENNATQDDLALPFWRYRYFAVLAMVAEAEGDYELARTMAGNALDAAALGRGPFRNHPSVGVVRIDDDVLHEKLEKLARSAG